MLKISKIRKEIRDKQFSSEFEKDIIDLLDEKVQDLERLRHNFDSKRGMKRFISLKQRFPLFNDYITKLKEYDDYPNLNICILVAWLIEKNIHFFYKRLEKQLSDLNHYLATGDNEDGKAAYEFLFKDGKRGVSESVLVKELNSAIKDMSIELNDYENESEAYLDRDIGKKGLITNDAVKCLKDFNGRTFPFLRTISMQVKPNMNVLEIGVGTGILSVASVVSGAKKVTGVEINPVTCLLAYEIITYLEENKVIKKKSIEIFWGDVLKFGKEEYKEYRGKTFDVLISENIYTGMFFELQMGMIDTVLKNGLVRCENKLVHGFYTLATNSPVIPEGMSSGIELVELGRNNFKGATEVLLDLKKEGVKLTKLTRDHIYDQIAFSCCDRPEIVTMLKFRILQDGFANALNFYSTIRMMEGDYIDRNENNFLNNDSFLIFNKPVPLKKGDVVVIGLAYNESDNVDDVILEIRKMNVDGSVNEKYDARLNISEKKHRDNMNNFLKKNKCKHPVNLSHMGDFEIVRSCSFDNGIEKRWLSTTDYISRKGYGV